MACLYAARNDLAENTINKYGSRTQLVWLMNGTLLCSLDHYATITNEKETNF